MDPYGLMVLLVALVLVSACLTAGLYGAMYAVHKYAGNRIPDHSYRNFDFDHVRKEQLSEFLVRIAAITFSATLVLHILEFGAVGFYIRAYPWTITFALFILESAAIACGLIYILKLDRTRVVIFTSVAAALYICLYGIFIFQYLQ